MGLPAPVMVTGISVWFGGQSSAGLACARPQTGGALTFWTSTETSSPALPPAPSDTTSRKTSVAPAAVTAGATKVDIAPAGFDSVTAGPLDWVQA